MVPSFTDILRTELTSRRMELDTMSYDDEIAAKQSALDLLCRRLSLGLRPETLQASPLPRGYRTTSRRRIRGQGRNFTLELRTAAGGASLEPLSHLAIFEKMAEILRRPTMGHLTRDLNHVIARGMGNEPSVIFNLRSLDGAKIRRLRTAVDELRALETPIRSAHVFVDPSGSDYYLEADRPKGRLSWKTLYGPDHLRLCLRERILRYHPTAFCQINGSLIPAMVDTAERLLSPLASERLLDLYCGFGLFGLCLSDKVSAVLGMDWEGAAIESAKENAKRDPKSTSLSFRAMTINAEALRKLQPPKAGVDELILLDPPRSGAVNGVVEALAERHPKRVVHVLCNVDRLGLELGEWRRCGYEASALACLDMFPGTLHLELMLKLEPRASSTARPSRNGPAARPRPR
jgi:tRNA/tmRNA/rRNA uracil-C5-methylase (TrmA/RlmC/RlmD family)